MTPKPESETDPWAAVDRQMEILAAWSRTPPATFDELAQPIIGLVVAVNAARAAEAAQHQQEIAAKDEMIGRWTQTGLTLMKFFAAVPAMNESDMPEFLWREVPTLIRSARQAAATTEARLAAVEAERDRLKAALSQAAQDLETVGNDYPAWSCWQWCAERAGVAYAALSGEGTAKP